MLNKSNIPVKLLLTALIVLSASALSAAPEFKVDGTVSHECYSIHLGDDGIISLTNAKGTKFLIRTELLSDHGKLLPMKMLDDSGLDIIRSEKKAVYAGKYSLPDGRFFWIEYSLSLTDQGNARISLVFKTPIPIAQIFSVADVSISIPLDAIGLKEICIDRKSISIPLSLSGKDSKHLYNETVSSLVFFPNDPDGRVSLAIQNAGDAELNVNDSDSKTGNLVFQIKPKENKVIFDVLLNEIKGKSSGEKYANIDFWASDRLKMPQYKLSENLVQNPSFEDGLKYWTFGPLGKAEEMRIGEHYTIAEKGWAGRYCLKIQGEKGQSPAHVATFGIPVESGMEYTLSFRAKADRNGVRLNSMPFSGVWGKFPGGKTYVLSTEWQCYSNTFKAPNNILALDFGINNPDSDCIAWIDSVQFQKACHQDDQNKSLDKYKEKPYGVCFKTTRRNNLFQPGENTDATFYLHGSPLSKGTFSYRAIDFNDVTVEQGESSFTINQNGFCYIPAPWANKLDIGLYVIESSMQTEDGFFMREFDRIAIMPSVKKKPRLHGKFFCILNGSRWANWARSMDLFQYFGINSAINFDPETPKFREEMKKAGIFYFSSIFKGGSFADDWNIKEEYYLHQSKNDLAVIENTAFLKAKENPDIAIWKTINEPGSGSGRNPVDDVDEMKKMVRCIEAARKGIIRANPKALVMTPDPANMYPTAGIKYIDTFLAAGGKDICDIAAIHPYRVRPESPDLDADTATLLRVLKKHKFTGDVWFTEGIYHQNYVIPELGLDTHRGCSSDHYRGGPLTYHMGWGEKMALAYTMRSWLVGLKYANRVKLYVDWNFRSSSVFGLDMIPNAKSFAPNTLTRLLGMAEYRCDIDLGRDIRCYLFEDDKKRPVAVIWTYDYLVDTGNRLGPEMSLSHIPSGTEFIDCLGKTVQLPDSKMRISPFPFFLRGKPGTLDEFRKALSQCRVNSSDASPVDMFATVSSLTQVNICVRNLLSRTLYGKMKISEQDTTLFDDKIAIAGKSTWQFPVTAQKYSKGINPFLVKAEFTPADEGKTVKKDIRLEIIPVPKITSPIVIDGDLKDWPEIAKFALQPRFTDFPPRGKDPAATMDLKSKYPKGVSWKGNEDLSAELYTAWDTKNLYIAVKVKDDIFSPAPTLNSSWTGDGIQLYFDCWGDARQQSYKGFDNNDQTFDLWPSGKNLTIKRAIAPEQQVAFLKTGAVTAAKTAFRKIEGGYVCEIALPKREIMPVNLSNGSSFGFSMIVNDNDGEYRKRGLCLTLDGNEPYMRPDQYPVMVLENNSP